MQKRPESAALPVSYTHLKAVNELGMVYADKDQIVEYDNPNGDYVKQYEEIPDDGMLASSKDVQN